MKNSFLHDLKQVSKITFYILLLHLTSFGVLLANDGKAQAESVKDVEISVVFQDNRMISILQAIEDQTDFRFSYDRSVVDVYQVVALERAMYRGNVYGLLLDVSKKAAVQFKQIQNSISIAKRKVTLKSTEYVEVLQERLVTGTIQDEQGGALPGVSVLVKGTSSGTTTDVRGNYSISVADDEAVLVFSFVGFKSQEVRVGSRSVVDVELEFDVAALEEVVVVGYGTQRKQTISSAISSIAASSVNTAITGNATQALIGKAAGVRVEVNGGAPGAGANVIIRGTGSLSNQNPLFVIDGVFSDDMSFLNPADIESIEVLKDAAAASIYGARAGQGVILITTKSGGRNQPMRVDLDASVGFATAYRQLDFLNADNYVANRVAAFENDGADFTTNFFDFDENVDSDIQDASLQTGIVQNYGVRLYGGGQNSNYSISLNRLDQEGPVKFSEFERTSIRVNSGLERGRFEFNQSLFLARSINNPNEDFGRQNGHLPVSPITSPDNPDRYVTVDNGVLGTVASANFLGLADFRDRQDIRDNILGNIGASYEFFEGLKFKLNLSLNYSNLKEYQFLPTYFFGNNDSGLNNLSTSSDSRTTFISTIVENILTYERGFNGHNINLLAGYSRQNDETDQLFVDATGFPNNDTRSMRAANDIRFADSPLLPRNIESFFGRLNYDYQGKYLFSASIRRDGSSNFGEDNRFGVFPSFSAGWNIAQETFFNVDFISDLKVRGSWGVLGSDNLVPFSYVANLNTTSQYTLGVDQQRRNGTAQTVPVNPDVKWEETTTSNFGFEATLFDGKVELVADYYQKTSEDILVELAAAPSTGTSEPFPINAATIENNGFEFQLGYRNYDSDFKYSITGQFTTLNNEVTSLGDNVDPIIAGAFTSGQLFATRTEAGQPVAYFWGFETDGIYQNQAEVDAETITGRTIVPGDFRFVDQNGDNVINEEDRTFLGSPIPDFEYGLNFTASYKNLDLTLFFQGVQGNEIWNGQLYHGVFTPNSPKRSLAGDAWSETNASNRVPRASQGDAALNARESDFYVEDGSYFRLQNLMLGYTVPTGLLESIGFAKLRGYLQVENLFVIDDYSGYFPEVGRALRRGATLFDRGVDENVYPVPRTVTIGLQASF